MTKTRSEATPQNPPTSEQQASASANSDNTPALDPSKDNELEATEGENKQNEEEKEKSFLQKAAELLGITDKGAEEQEDYILDWIQNTMRLAAQSAQENWGGQLSNAASDSFNAAREKAGEAIDAVKDFFNGPNQQPQQQSRPNPLQDRAADLARQVAELERRQLELEALVKKLDATASELNAKIGELSAKKTAQPQSEASNLTYDEYREAEISFKNDIVEADNDNTEKELTKKREEFRANHPEHARNYLNNTAPPIREIATPKASSEPEKTPTASEASSFSYENYRKGEFVLKKDILEARLAGKHEEAQGIEENLNAHHQQYPDYAKRYQKDVNTPPPFSALSDSHPAPVAEAIPTITPSASKTQEVTPSVDQSSKATPLPQEPKP